MTHGEIIKLVLKLRGMNVTQLSEKSGINRQTIYTIINRNQARTAPKIYCPLADALKIPENFFTNAEIKSEDIKKFLLPNRIPQYTKDNIYTAPNNISPKHLDREDPKYLSDMMIKRNISINEIFQVMKYTGLYTTYSFTDLVDITENPLNGDTRLFNFIEHYLTYGVIATQDELSLLDKYRSLDSVEHDYINAMIQNFLDVKEYINKKYEDS